MKDKKEIKYFGCDSKQDLIDEIYEQEVTICYREAEYVTWLDGLGYCIGMTNFRKRQATDEEHEKSIKAYKTVEELIDNYVFYDGTKLSDAMEMDVRDIDAYFL